MLGRVLRRRGSLRMLSPVFPLAATAIVSCSWNRFDAFEDEPPVVLLDRPAGAVGYGASLNAIRGQDDSWLYVGSGPGGTAFRYEVGSPNATQLPISEPWICGSGEGNCTLAAAPALGMRIPIAGIEAEDGPCFSAGLGRAEDELHAIRAWCLRAGWQSIPLPDAILTDVVEPAAAELDSLGLALAAGKSKSGALLAALRTENRAWAYLDGDAPPVEIVLPASAEGQWGTALAVLEGGESPVFVIGNREASELRFYRIGSDGSAVQLACFQGSGAFAEAVVVGRFGDDAFDDLAVTLDGSTVVSIDGAAVDEAQNSAEDACTPVEESPLVAAHFGCDVASFDALEGCSGSGFGTAMASADIDGDGIVELAVAAPTMTVGGTIEAGAVLVYRVEQPDEPVEAHYLARRNRADHLGEVLELVPEGAHTIVAAAVPRRDQVALFYCSGLVPQEQRYGRCD